jgi:uncharacterized protein (TIGR03437 family)
MNRAVLLALAAVASQAQVISTFAGAGIEGFAGDDGPAIRAWLQRPGGLALDGKGNVYIGDTGNFRVRKVNSAGTITTVAGNGMLLYSGDGVAATSTALFPQVPGGYFAVAVDAEGNLFIADSANNRVRKVNTAGIISTVAGNGLPLFSGDGGPATSAGLGRPSGIALDQAGNLYIAELLSRRIRKVDRNGTISTFAGTGGLGSSGDGGAASSASFQDPTAVAVDSSGNVYVTESSGLRIRRIDAASGVIRTVAGNGTAGFSGDGGPATSAQLNGPLGIAVDAAGNLYIADGGNSRIRRVNSAGVISTIAGRGVSGFSGDGGPPTSAEIFFPADVAVDTDGTIYIADYGNNRIRRITAGPVAPPAVPVIRENGVGNGANFTPPIIPGSLATIFGTNLSPVTMTWDNAIVNGQLPTTLGGVSVTVDGKPAYISYVSRTQINIVVPAIAFGPVPVRVTTPVGSSGNAFVLSVETMPSFLKWPGDQIVATRPDFSLAARAGTFQGLTTIAAKPGDVIILYGIGFGPTTPVAPIGSQLPSDRLYSLAGSITVNLTGTPVNVIGAALAPGFAGLYQIAIQLPNTLSDADYIVITRSNGVQASIGTLVVRR